MGVFLESQQSPSVMPALSCLTTSLMAETSDSNLLSSTVSPGNLELSFMYVQWSQSVTLFPMIEAGKFIAPQALLAFGHHLRHRAALKRLAQDHRDALANLR